MQIAVYQPYIAPKEGDMFTINQQVSWWYVPRGGYGFGYYVDGIVRKVTPKRVQIEVSKVDGERVLRWVTPDKLKVQRREG